MCPNTFKLAVSTKYKILEGGKKPKPLLYISRGLFYSTVMKGCFVSILHSNWMAIEILMPSVST